MTDTAGFREVAHTADWELHVWAPDLPALVSQAAKGMYALSGTKLVGSPRIFREFEIQFLDQESLVVDFLSELLFFAEEEGVGFDSFQVSSNHDRWFFKLGGAPIEEQAKEIKAVTFHGMRVTKTEIGLEVNIVFDV